MICEIYKPHISLWICNPFLIKPHSKPILKPYFPKNPEIALKKHTFQMSEFAQSLSGYAQNLPFKNLRKVIESFGW